MPNIILESKPKINKFDMNSFHMMIEKQQNNSTTGCNIHSCFLTASFVAVTSQFEQKTFPQSSSSNPLGSIHIIGGFLVVDD